MKIGLVASSGGHLTELLRLSAACNRHERFFVTAGVTLEHDLSSGTRTYRVIKANRRHPFFLSIMTVQAAYIFLKERPNVVISTGAAVGCVFCLLAKLFGRKVVWVENISHVDRLTLSGRIIRRAADLFLVQWPELTTKYKNTEYAGTLL